LEINIFVITFANALEVPIVLPARALFAGKVVMSHLPNYYNLEVMKKLLLMLFLFIPLMGFCQSEEKQYYIYNIISFEGDFTKEDFKVYYDDGIEVKRMRNDKGEKARFSTPAGALMYFISQGWEMYLNGATSKGSSYQGTGSSQTSSYWIMRKPCTKDEFEKAVEAAKKK